uniref:Uncharacterized protein n=1 Tax=Romanomermis culicivorax TaxID=13658 RepID=A0A915IMV7_ROMCU
MRKLHSFCCQEASHGFTSDEDDDVDDEEDLLQLGADHHAARQRNSAKFGNGSTAKQDVRSAESKFEIIDSSSTTMRPSGSGNRFKTDEDFSEDEL